MVINPNGYFNGVSYFVQQSKGSEWPCQEAKILCRSHRQKTKNMTKPGGPNGVTAAGAASAPLPVNRLLPPQRCLKPCSILSCLLAALQYHPPHDKSTHSGVSFRISSTSRLSAIVCVTCRKKPTKKNNSVFLFRGKLLHLISIVKTVVNRFILRSDSLRAVLLQERLKNSMF